MHLYTGQIPGFPFEMTKEQFIKHKLEKTLLEWIDEYNCFFLKKFAELLIKQDPNDKPDYI